MFTTTYSCSAQYLSRLIHERYNSECYLILTYLTYPPFKQNRLDTTGPRFPSPYPCKPT